MEKINKQRKTFLVKIAVRLDAKSERFAIQKAHKLLGKTAKAKWFIEQSNGRILTINAKEVPRR